MSCHKLCEVALFEGREKIGGPGKLVQIDESKIEKGNVIVVIFLYFNTLFNFLVSYNTYYCYEHTHITPTGNLLHFHCSYSKIQYFKTYYLLTYLPTYYYCYCYYYYNLHTQYKKICIMLCLVMFLPRYTLPFL